MRSSLSSLALAVGLTFSSPVYGEENSHVIIQDGASSYSLPYSFVGAEGAFTENDVSKALSQNSDRFFLGVDGLIDSLEPYHLGLDELPETREAREIVLQAYSREYYARLFPEGSEQHKAANRFLLGEIDKAGFATIVDNVLKNPMVEKFYDIEDQVRIYLDDLDGLPLSIEQEEALRNIVQENLEEIIKHSLLIEFSGALFGENAWPFVSEFVDQMRGFEETLWDKLERSGVDFRMPGPSVEL